MPEQRVSDELLSNTLLGRVSYYYADSDVRMFALDLRDARARLAALEDELERTRAEVGEQVALGRKWMERADALEPVVRAAVQFVVCSTFDVQQQGWRDLHSSVDALPEELRKEFGG